MVNEIMESREKYGPKDIIKHLTLPPDYFIAKLDRRNIFKLSGGISILDDHDPEDPYTVEKIISNLNIEYKAHRPFFLAKRETPDIHFKNIKDPDALENIVVIPVLAYAEQVHIVNALLQYKKQTIDKSQFAIFLYLNDDGDKKHDQDRQSTLKLIDDFVKHNGELNIYYTYKKLTPDERTIGQIKKTLLMLR